MSFTALEINSYVVAIKHIAQFTTDCVILALAYSLLYLGVPLTFADGPETRYGCSQAKGS